MSSPETTNSHMPPRPHLIGSVERPRSMTTSTEPPDTLLEAGMDWIIDNAWIVWLVLILVFVIIEMLSLEFTFLMIAVGSAVGLVSGLLGAPWWLQIVIAAVASVVLLAFVRPSLLRALHKGEDKTPSNVEALLNMPGEVLRPVSSTGGQVRLANGDTWTAILLPTAPGGTLEPGTHVSVHAIQGATAVVAPAERKAL
jgi:membrane protein implicated in regulation of membrane protease activity